jgi:hypothetical protein
MTSMTMINAIPEFDLETSSFTVQVGAGLNRGCSIYREGVLPTRGAPRGGPATCILLGIGTDESATTLAVTSDTCRLRSAPKPSEKRTIFGN